jgi:hypothetical protein
LALTTLLAAALLTTTLPVRILLVLLTGLLLAALLLAALLTTLMLLAAALSALVLVRVTHWEILLFRGDDPAMRITNPNPVRSRGREVPTRLRSQLGSRATEQTILI